VAGWVASTRSRPRWQTTSKLPRAAVLELLAHPGLDDDANALSVLRVNIAGASPNQLADKTGVTGATVRRIEDGYGCNRSTAKKLADRFGLRVLGLFGQRDSDELIAATVAELREAVH
jgi:DNA-binding XRE family transcriptional regulator